MNGKKLFLAFIAAFIFIFLFGFVWHGKLMQSAYIVIAGHWRSEADFGRHFPMLILGHAVMAFFLALIYASFAPAGGVGTGARLGILVGFLYTGYDLIRFAVEPLTRKILALWFVGDLLEFAIAGAIIGAIYRAETRANTNVWLGGHAQPALSETERVSQI
jgi:hypothetical protein